MDTRLFTVASSAEPESVLTVIGAFWVVAFRSPLKFSTLIRPVLGLHRPTAFRSLEFHRARC